MPSHRADNRAQRRITSKDVSVADLLHDFYLVPDYQREYAWTDEQVKFFLDDINEEFDGSKDSESDYFMGTMVVCPRKDKTFEVIDGQQRLTTMVIALSAARDHITSRAWKPVQLISPLLFALHMDENGNERQMDRVRLQYQDSAKTLAAIASGSFNDDSDEKASLSSENLRLAYDTALDFFSAEFDKDEESFRKFISYFINRVRLIRVVAEDVAHALKIFETINARGLGLGPVDLLKNLLFMHSNPEQYATLKTTWSKMVSVLHGARENPLRFVRYFIFANYKSELIREDEVYKWFLEHETLVRYKADPEKFATTLYEASRIYSKYLNKTTNRYIANIQYFSKSARQHLILLLACRHLGEKALEAVCERAERLYFVYRVSGLITRDLERRMIEWAEELRSVKKAADLPPVMERTLDKAMHALKQRFVDSLIKLDESKLGKKQLKYLLGKLTQFIEELAFPKAAENDVLRKFAGPKIEIEHVLPQQPSELALAEFGEPKDVAAVSSKRLGNLLLVEKSLNGVLGNRPYSEKRLQYKKSNMLLTKITGEPIEYGKNTKVKKATQGLQSFDDWTVATIDKRQEMLARLACRVWDMSWLKPVSGSSETSVPEKAGQ